jgi:hypothetical protein
MINEIIINNKPQKRLTKKLAFYFYRKSFNVKEKRFDFLFNISTHKNEAIICGILYSDFL